MDKHLLRLFFVSTLLLAFVAGQGCSETSRLGAVDAVTSATVVVHATAAATR